VPISRVRALTAAYDYQLKFVIAKPEDLDEARELAIGQLRADPRFAPACGQQADRRGGELAVGVGQLERVAPFEGDVEPACGRLLACTREHLLDHLILGIGVVLARQTNLLQVIQALATAGRFPGHRDVLRVVGAAAVRRRRVCHGRRR